MAIILSAVVNRFLYFFVSHVQQQKVSADKFKIKAMSLLLLFFITHGDPHLEIQFFNNFLYFFVKKKKARIFLDG